MHATTTPLTPVQSELHDAIGRLIQGVKDPARARQACADMDRTRQELERKHGVLDIGVSAIRELRGALPEE
jgi:hypothetical protein